MKPRSRRRKTASAGADTIDMPAKDGFMPPEAEPASAGPESAPEMNHDSANDAAEQILGANPVIGIDKAEVLDAAQRALRLALGRPQMLLEETLALGKDWLEVIAGRSQASADPKRSSLQSRDLAEERLLQAIDAGLPGLARCADAHARARPMRRRKIANARASCCPWSPRPSPRRIHCSAIPAR